ncbi:MULTISPECIES: hypothetical protein [Sphingobacterium]|uniref:hypothetical protein n=1 Tax=Sphingobacterium TaxID=28453 RepID=UPI00257E16DF|nr:MULTISPECIES: hypothetical protein [Sphingobacterium]
MNFRIRMVSSIEISTCDRIDSRLSVINKTDKDICVYLTKDSSTNNAKIYFSEYGKVDKQLRQYYFIKPNDSTHFSVMDDWDSPSNYRFNDDSMIFVFSVDSIQLKTEMLDKHPQTIIRKFEIAQKTLIDNNWRFEIKSPPTKNIQQRMIVW